MSHRTTSPRRSPSPRRPAPAEPKPTRAELVAQLAEARAQRDAAEKSNAILRPLVLTPQPEAEPAWTMRSLCTDVRAALDDLEVVVHELGGIAATAPCGGPGIDGDRKVKAATARIADLRADAAEHRWTALYKLRQLERQLLQLAHSSEHAAAATKAREQLTAAGAS